MASDGQPVKIPVVSLVHGSQAPTTVVVQHSGNVFAAQRQARGARGRPANLQAQVQLLNKYLNDSGKPDQFRVAPDSDDKLIQQINPANGEVIGRIPGQRVRGVGAQRRHFRRGRR